MTKGDVDTYNEDGQRKNRIEGYSRASSVHDRKTDAQPAGREMAIGRGVEHVDKRRTAPSTTRTPTRANATITRPRANQGQVISDPKSAGQRESSLCSARWNELEAFIATSNEILDFSDPGVPNCGAINNWHLSFPVLANGFATVRPRL